MSATQAWSTTTESCLRCGARMEWRHGTWQCPRCHFKVGCCEGETGECTPDTTSQPLRP